MCCLDHLYSQINSEEDECDAMFSNTLTKQIRPYQVSMNKLQ